MNYPETPMRHGKTLAWPKEKGLVPLTEKPHPDIVGAFRLWLHDALGRGDGSDDLYARPKQFPTALLPAYVEAILEHIDMITPAKRPNHKLHFAAIAANFLCAHLSPFEGEPDPARKTTVSPRGLDVLQALGKQYQGVSIP